MSLQAARAKTLELLLLGVDLRHEAEVLRSAEQWFELFKEWERAESFERAFQDNRMTARMAPLSETNELKKFSVVADRGEAREMKLNPNVQSLPAASDPQNFLDGKKNDLGLHEMSAVLLEPGRPISKQTFAKPGAVPVFMPIPDEGDLQLFDQLCQAAKRNRQGALYRFVVEKRARMTRITYGSADDMAVGFLRIEKGDGKDHFKYGHGNIQGHITPPEVLTQRSADALHYRSKIARVQSRTSNNEVTIKYRQHAGGFPFVGNPGPLPGHAGYPPVKKGEYVLASFTTGPQGLLNDETGVLTPFPRR